MSMSLNRVTLLGNLGGDPEIRRTQSGVPIGNFTMATSEEWKDRATGEKKERTQWHRVVVFATEGSDGLVGVVEKYLKKGSKVYVEGQLETRKWQDPDGKDRYTTEVILRPFNSRLLLLGSPSGHREQGDPGPGEERSSGGTGGARPQQTRSQEMDDDIPFSYKDLDRFKP
jgi:single-strand DNA-binding protein